MTCSPGYKLCGTNGDCVPSVILSVELFTLVAALKLITLLGIWNSEARVKVVAVGTEAIPYTPSYAPSFAANSNNCSPVPADVRITSPDAAVTANLNSHQLVIPCTAKFI